MFNEDRAKEMFAKASRQQKLDMVRVISERKEPNSLPFVLSSLREAIDPFVISALVKTAGILGAATTINELQPYLHHEDGRVRANAIEGLEAIGDELAWPLIVPMLYDEVHRVRANAARALLHFDGQEARGLVGELVDGPTTKERATALYFLRSVEVPWAEELLWQFIDKEEKADLHRLACGLLAEKGGPKSVSYINQKLSSCSKNEKRCYEIALSALKRRCQKEITKEFEPFAIKNERPRRVNRKPSSLTNSQWQVLQVKKEESSSWKVFAPLFLGCCIMSLAGLVLFGRGAASTPSKISSSKVTRAHKRTTRKAPSRSKKAVKPAYRPARRRSLGETQRRRQLSIARKKRLVGRRKPRRW